MPRSTSSSPLGARSAGLFASKGSLGNSWARSGERPSGFDYLRIALAVAVVLWHSYQVSYGTAAAIELWLTPLGLLLQLVLPMFFCISGFLVCGSLDRSRNLLSFLGLRILRIYPALCLAVLTCALVLGPLMTTLSLEEYFWSSGFRLYFLNGLGLIHKNLPGVFESNTYRSVVNTSLWTVPYEIISYLVLTGLILIGFTRSRMTSLVMFFVCTLGTLILLKVTGKMSPAAGGVSGRVLPLCFLAGVIIFRWKDRLPLNAVAAGSLTLVSMVLLRYDYGVFVAPLPLAYVTVTLGLANPSRNMLVASGDYSYGTYLYAAPLQRKRHPDLTFSVGA